MFAEETQTRMKIPIQTGYSIWQLKNKQFAYETANNPHGIGGGRLR